MQVTQSTHVSHVTQATQQKTVSLVLGGGGARGYAHIGVIQWLTENGYVIHNIAGTSMGALVGGIYAAGKLSTYAEWALALERLEVVRLLDLAFGGAGLIKGDRVIGVLRNLVGDVRIEDLDIAFTAVAMDLESGKEIWLRDGLLFDAVRASIAIPLLLTPVEYRGRMLVDGGLVNPVPIAPTLNDTTDLTVAVNLGGPAEAGLDVAITDSLPAQNDYARRIRAFVESVYPQAVTPETPGMIDVALRSMEAMENTIARLKLAAYTPDITISIPRNACRIHEFWRAEELIRLGRERTARAFGRNGEEHPA
ncbi:patatin-like phospholipase family protein [Lacisediminimonas profundi]|uniref:patatin-like phospholipase family protein n=1 Tax=Lacisediminimonas profundi TaxID=2603856 RepID=UPI00124BC81F|nr:patatin-like phospholipase family protein [Lacisediminimonas profundi]